MKHQNIPIISSVSRKELKATKNPGMIRDASSGWHRSHTHSSYSGKNQPVPSLGANMWQLFYMPGNNDTMSGTTREQNFELRQEANGCTGGRVTALLEAAGGTQPHPHQTASQGKRKKIAIGQVCHFFFL